MDSAMVSSDLLDTIVQMSKDPVPNVRFNVSECIRALAQMGQLDAESYEGSVRACLARMINDEDSDVRYFADMAIQACEDVVRPSEQQPQQGEPDAMLLTLRPDAAAAPQT